MNGRFVQNIVRSMNGVIMNNTIKFICYYFICLLIVSACWVGLEYTIEGYVHSSDVDGFIAIIFSWFVADKLCD